MLTQDLAIADFDFSNLTVMPDRLNRYTHAHYLPLADELIAIYSKGVGEVRKHLHDQVRRTLQSIPDCPTRRIGAFCKLLDEASEYQQSGSAAAKLRLEVFSRAARKHPLVTTPDQLFDNDQSRVKAEIAADLGKTWKEVEGSLFADVIEFHRLVKPPEGLNGSGLLARYNVAQTQAALYGAVSMTVWAGDDFKLILRFAKLARLMHSIARQGSQYVFHFNGPASVLRQTRRYGVSFARFLPGLLSAKDWRMQATILGPAKRRFALRLTDKDGLKSEAARSDFDSRLESDFANDWMALESAGMAGGWTLAREGTVLHQGQTVFTPDFSLRHPEHGEVLLEIIGFWTPEYLLEKSKRVEQFRTSARIVLAIDESVGPSIPDFQLPRITFKIVLKAKEVVALLTAFC